MPPQNLTVLAACPTYDGNRLNSGALLQLQGAGVTVMEVQMSLLARGFNESWCYAHNHQFTHFIMLHADIKPERPDWVKTLLQISLETEATVVSAVSPIKTPHKSTSTAIETEDPWNPRRLSLEEIAAKPLTWTEDGLLVNTGLMVVDLRQRLTRKLHFEINDRIIPDKSGKLVAESQPEDWNFSRQVRDAGGTVFATRAIPLGHWGTFVWPNYIQDAE